MDHGSMEIVEKLLGKTVLCGWFETDWEIGRLAVMLTCHSLLSDLG